jgi:hypothetical protein
VKNQKLILLNIMLACSLAGAASISQQSGPSQPSQASGKISDLVAHGIGTSKAEIIRFFEKGFPANTDATRFPEKPVEKSQLAIDAMERLVQLRAKEADDLLLRIASYDLPPGVQWLLQEDLSRTTPEGREEFRGKALRLLRYNAIISLSTLGDTRAIPIVRTAMQQETSVGSKLQYCLCLALLGDASGLDYIVDVIVEDNRHESAAAARVFYFITGQNFGYTENTPIRLRRTRSKMYRDWWKSNRSQFQLDRSAISARRSQPEVPIAFEPRSTRDLVKLSTYYFDFDNRLNTREARMRLATAGSSLNDDLEKIATNVNEDLDVRLEAINWYFENNRDDSRPLLRRLRRDENPEIVEKCKSLQEQLESDSARAAKAQPN